MNYKSIYILRVHEINDYIKFTYDKLVKDLGYDNVFILYDATNTEIPDGSIISNDQICIISDDLCAKNNSLHNYNKENIDNKSKFSMNYFHPETGFVLAGYWATFIKNMNYDFIWFIEYDVYCRGNFKIAFDKCDSIYADFMARGRDTGSESFRVGFSDEWCFWNDIYGDISKVPMKYRVGCFFPMVRFSKKMLDTIKDYFNRSTGFCEVYIPTLAVEENLVIKPMPIEIFGIFRFRPNIIMEELLEFEGFPDLIFHPIKITN